MNVVILDTGCCNLLSIKLAIIKLGYNPIITHNTEIILHADKLLIPGVGSASSIMNFLHKKNIVEVIKNLTCPTLGICLGMQVLSSYSDESGGMNMLSVLDEHVSLLSTKNLPLPHIGWNQVLLDTDHILFNGIRSGAWFYFLHSYSFSINQYTIGKSCYDKYFFSSVIQKNNFFGVQFHPEKSGLVGSRLLFNFLEM
ncbi:Imidazole glycerol phosphate synthase subunit HisH [Buchnera aphidicola (Pterocallis alni)]|uniref:imidazole glycerol phosphate synthase subunit HisH n=1 Tax=Buchnera aphidicola TaxID=9 RepID=UPI003463EFC5